MTACGCTHLGSPGFLPSDSSGPLVFVYAKERKTEVSFLYLA